MTCLVTGAAGGIGRASAIAIGRKQPVALLDIDASGLDETSRLVTAAGGRAQVSVCDIREPASCESALADAASLGSLTDVVCAAGIFAGDRPLLETTAELWNHILQVNVLGTANVVRAALPALIAHRGGDVVLVGSIGAGRGRRAAAAYSASKAALIGLMGSLVADYGELGVRTNCVAPGPTATGLATNPRAPQLNARGRSARPEEIAAAIAWLTHDDSDWIVGAVLPVDAGESAAASGMFRPAGLAE
jgi:NAD(P)-dependent dehydrogenase (short-subunit alcohol dehydrogenase family)